MLALKNGGFFFAAGPCIEVNRHFLKNEYGDLSFFSAVLNGVINFSM